MTGFSGILFFQIIVCKLCGSHFEKKVLIKSGVENLLLFHTLSGYFFQYGRDYFCSHHLGLICITMGRQNNSSHNSSVPKKHPLSEQGAFFVPVTIKKPASRDFHLFHAHLFLQGEELKTLRSGNKETLALGLCNKPPIRTGRFFCAFLRVGYRLFLHLKSSLDCCF